MTAGLDRRSFLQLGAAAGVAALAQRWGFSQAAQGATTDRLAQMRAGAASTPIKTTKLYDNIWLLQGAGGNMAVQTGKDGVILIDSELCKCRSTHQGSDRRCKQRCTACAHQYALACGSCRRQ